MKCIDIPEMVKNQESLQAALIMLGLKQRQKDTFVYMHPTTKQAVMRVEFHVLDNVIVIDRYMSIHLKTNEAVLKNIADKIKAIKEKL